MTFSAKLSGCLLVLAIAMVLLSVGFGINYFAIARTCPDSKLYELPSFVDKQRVRCRKNVKIQNYSATFAISPDSLEALKQWNPFAPNIVLNQTEWRQNQVHSTTAAQKTELEKKAEALPSFWYKVYRPGDRPFEILVDTSNDAEYVGYIQATFIVW